MREKEYLVFVFVCVCVPVFVVYFCHFFRFFLFKSSLHKVIYYINGYKLLNSSSVSKNE